MASVSDYFTTAAPLWTGTIGSGGVGDDTTQTVPLSSVTGLTNGEVYYATIDRVDSNGVATPSFREVVKGVLSGSNLINCTRGVEGTAQQHNAGKVVEILFTAAQWNDLKTGLEVEHNADGTHKSTLVTTLKAAGSDITTGTNDTKIVTPKALTDAGLVLDTDGTLAADSDTKIATQKAVKTYVAANAANTDGWIADTDTWTYVSATSFKVTGKNVTAKFSKGTRIKLTQTTDKYFVVTSSSFSTDTTVTLTGGTNYTLANAAITSPYYSYQANPQGYPGWFNFTPTLTGGSAGPSSFDCKFNIIGNICNFYLQTTSDYTSNSASFTFTIPVSSVKLMHYVPCGVEDNGTFQTTPGALELGAGSNVVNIYKSFLSNGFTTSGAKRVFTPIFQIEF